jgi:hypothetical protein
MRLPESLSKKIAPLTAVGVAGFLGSAANYTFGQTDISSTVQVAAHVKPANRSDSKLSEWRNKLSIGCFRVYSMVETDNLQSQMAALLRLPIELESQLQIPLSDEEIHVVVLNDERSYDLYLERHYPDLPKRRALYVRHRGPGLVITFMHSDWIIDVRHECVHALLDRSRLSLPAWLDEGIAEYFEDPNPNRLSHRNHRATIEKQIRYGQVPRIDELASVENAPTLSPKEYRDAWSVVAFMMNANETTRSVLLKYLRDARETSIHLDLERQLPTAERAAWRSNYINLFSSVR